MGFAMKMKRPMPKFTLVFVLGMLLGMISCQSQEEGKMNNSLQSSAEAVAGDKLFEEEKKEGCTTEEDLEKKLVEASKAPPSLQGTTDPGCEVK